MRVGFDLDGVLDIPVMADLLRALIEGGHEVHIITGTFTEATGWQDAAAKREKLHRHGIPFVSEGMPAANAPVAVLHILDAVPQSYDQSYRLRDLGLRKGALCEKLGIKVFIDDSETYCELIPAMSGDTTVLHLR